MNFAAAAFFAATAAGFALCGGAPAAQAADDPGPYTMWIWSTDDERNKRVAVVEGDREAYAVAALTDRRRESRLLDGAEAEEALDEIEARFGADGVSLVEIDPEGEGGVHIVADDDDEHVVIRIDENGIVIRGNDGEDDIDIRIGGRTRGDVEIHSDDGHLRERVIVRANDDDEERVVIIRGASAEDAEDFIDDIDDMSREVREQMKRRLGFN
ncbi:MAG: hypothetical protein Tsb0010_12300 [Parvularculaceae bacterium]